MKLNDLTNNIDLLYTDNNLVNILINFESILDYMHIYSYKNWITGEIALGPEFISDYWIKIILMYPYQCMPDPRACQRLTQHNIQIFYKEDQFERNVDIYAPDDLEIDGRGRYVPKKKVSKIWLVKMIIPRELFKEIDFGRMNIENNFFSNVDIITALNKNDDTEFFDTPDPLNESIIYGGFTGMIDKTINIDSHSTKIGEEEEAVVAEIQVISASAAEDLKRFIETSNIKHLDVSVSSTKLNMNKMHSVFVEFIRNKYLFKKIQRLLWDFDNIMGNKTEWKFKTIETKGNAVVFNKNNFQKYITANKKEYKQQFFIDNQ